MSQSSIVVHWFPKKDLERSVKQKQPNKTGTKTKEWYVKRKYNIFLFLISFFFFQLKIPPAWCVIYIHKKIRLKDTSVQIPAFSFVSSLQEFPFSKRLMSL